MSYPLASTCSVPEVQVRDFILSLDSFIPVFGSLEIGLVFASMTFGVVVTKAISYFRRNTPDGALVKTTVAGMLLLNVVQMIATIHAAYTVFVIYFGRLDEFASSQWSITLQILFTTVTASIAQTFFAFRLHAIMRNYFLTIIILFFVLFQLATAIYSITLLFTVSPASTLGYSADNFWSMIMTFSISAGINLVIAPVAYVRMQKPHVLQKHGRTTFMSELEYWTVKSLFFCSFVSIFAAITVTSMMFWVAATCVLGNLYTLSVLLTVLSRSNPPVDLSYRASEVTLADNTAIREELAKCQAIIASLTTTKDAGSPEHTVGYHLNDGAV
ncbi:hypothetical protein C8T65DRAFT_728753 [Cerioporus squamosus]|nr:hypothetical protein C8T65DRAFT_728753 [Cerioporus squamosus]